MLAILRRAAALAGALTVLFAPAAQAAVLNVAPVHFEFAPGGGAGVLFVTNRSDAPVNVQVRVFGWRLEDGADAYSPTGEIAFSPPMFELKPGARQIVRLKPRADAFVGRETAYRLFVDEIPGANRPGVLQLPIRMVLPVFLEPAEPGRGELAWRVVHRPGEAEATLIAVNSGGRRVRLHDLAYVAEGRPTPISPGLSGYVLAGQERHWTFQPPRGEAPLNLTASTDDGSLSATVPITTEP